MAVYRPKVSSVTVLPNPVTINSQIAITVTVDDEAIPVYSVCGIAGALVCGEAVLLVFGKEVIG